MRTRITLGTLILVLAALRPASLCPGTQEGAVTSPPAKMETGEGAANEKADIPQPSYGGISLGTIKPPSPGEEAAFKEMAEDIEIYNRGAAEFRTIIRNVIRREYELRKKQIEEEIGKQIDEEERLEEEARKSAIAYFEEFLEKYPVNEEYTPDAMFRLSELYYEQSYLDHMRAYDQYKEDYKKWKSKQIPSEPVEPSRDFDKTVGIYERLIENYPGYRNIDGVYYLLGFCLSEMGRFDEARNVWLSFSCSNRYNYSDLKKLEEVEEVEEEAAPGEVRPAESLREVRKGGEVEKEAVFAAEVLDTYRECRPLKEKSRFFTETWLRVGEYHFDFDYSKTGLSNAISSYKKALEDETSSFYDLALYKLAWSHWRNGNYPEAILNFIKVVEYSDRKAQETGKSGSQLRPEAIQYIALSLWESDWDGDNVPDAVAGFQRLKDPKYVPQDKTWTPEVYNWLGDVYIDDNANLKAIEVFEETLQRWPNAAEAPDMIAKIAKAYQREKMEQKVIDARARLAAYGRNSEWWNANMDKPELQEKALMAAEEALKQTALHHHEVAQNLKTAAKARMDPKEANELYMRAVEEYNFAATAYKKYLESYPNSADAYEINFYLAETYFWSRQYENSIPVYEAVRDSQMDNRYQKDSAFMVVKAVEELRGQETAKGSLVVRDAPPEPSPGPEGKPVVTPVPIPPVLQRHIAAQEGYMKLFPEDRKNTTVFTYNVAELYYNYGHWDEAKARFEKIYEAFCDKDDIAAYSWQNMSAMASTLEQLDESARLAALQKERKCGITKDLKVEMEETAVKVLKTKEAIDSMAMFYEAEKTGDIKQYEVAAERLERVVNDQPKHEDADKMLWNAAIAYEKCNKFASALRVTQRIIDEYPKSEFMGEALFKLGDNAFRAFEYPKALANYKLLADEPRFKDSPYRKPATQNAALILDNQQNYKEAASYWKRFSEITDKREDAMAASWNAARCYEKGKMWTETISEMKNFERKFAGAAEAADERVEAAWSVAEAYKKLGKKKDYENALMDVITRFNSVKANLKPGSTAIDHAAEGKFILVENGLADVEKFKLNTNNEKKVADDLKRLKEMRDSLIAQYAQVVSMASPEWSGAAQFRVGYLYETHAKILLDAPIPKSVTKLGPEAEEMYRERIMSLVVPLEDQTKAEYAKAQKIFQAAGVFNKWAELALDRLNAYNPDEYPLYKKGKTMRIEESFGTASFDMM